MKKARTLYLGLIFILAITFSGCTTLEQLQVKMGFKNNDFEYLKQGKIQKIIIQSTRDKGYKFAVTDKRAISDFYDILSSAKKVKQKSTLDPDYIFQMQESPNKVYTFKYVAGIDKEDAGNLYTDDNKVYMVSKRIDNDLIGSLWSTRAPKNFKKVYYDSIIQAADTYVKSKGNSKNIGINLSDDVDVQKFILSTDLEDFKQNLQQKVKNAELISKDENINAVQVLMSIETKGYTPSIYKSNITFSDKTGNTDIKYQVEAILKDGEWEIKIKGPN